MSKCYNLNKKLHVTVIYSNKKAFHFLKNGMLFTKILKFIPVGGMNIYNLLEKHRSP